MCARIITVLIAMICSSLLSPTSAYATITNWVLSGVMFDDGATASGTFSFDSSSDTVFDFDIETTYVGSNNFNQYDPEEINSSYSSSDTNLVVGFFTGGYYELTINFSSSLNAAGAIPILHNSNETIGDQYYSSTRYITAGSVIPASSISAVPELPVWAMMLAGFGIVGVAMRRRGPTIDSRYCHDTNRTVPKTG